MAVRECEVGSRPRMDCAGPVFGRVVVTEVQRRQAGAGWVPAGRILPAGWLVEVPETNAGDGHPYRTFKGCPVLDKHAIAGPCWCSAAPGDPQRLHLDAALQPARAGEALAGCVVVALRSQLQCSLSSQLRCNVAVWAQLCRCEGVCRHTRAGRCETVHRLGGEAIVARGRGGVVESSELR